VTKRLGHLISVTISVNVLENIGIDSNSTISIPHVLDTRQACILMSTLMTLTEDNKSGSLT
jgi:hypothetical protein